MLYIEPQQNNKNIIAYEPLVIKMLFFLQKG